MSNRKRASDALDNPEDGAAVTSSPRKKPKQTPITMLEGSMAQASTNGQVRRPAPAHLNLAQPPHQYRGPPFPSLPHANVPQAAPTSWSAQAGQQFDMTRRIAPYHRPSAGHPLNLYENNPTTSYSPQISQRHVSGFAPVPVGDPPLGYGNPSLQGISSSLDGASLSSLHLGKRTHSELNPASSHEAQSKKQRLPNTDYFVGSNGFSPSSAAQPAHGYQSSSSSPSVPQQRYNFEYSTNHVPNLQVSLHLGEFDFGLSTTSYMSPDFSQSQLLTGFASTTHLSVHLNTHLYTRTREYLCDKDSTQMKKRSSGIWDKKPSSQTSVQIIRLAPSS